MTRVLAGLTTLTLGFCVGYALNVPTLRTAFLAGEKTKSVALEPPKKVRLRGVIRSLDTASVTFVVQQPLAFAGRVFTVAIREEDAQAAREESPIIVNTSVVLDVRRQAGPLTADRMTLAVQQP